MLQITPTASNCQPFPLSHRESVSEEFMTLADYANALSDKLLDHMLDCTTCLDGSPDHDMETCPEYTKLRLDIALCGRPTRALVFAH